MLVLTTLLVLLFRGDLGELATFFGQIGGTVVSTYTALNPATPTKLPAPPTIPQSSAKATTTAAATQSYLVMGAVAALVLAAVLFIVKSGGRRR